MRYESGLNIQDADNERKFRERCLKNAERRDMRKELKQEAKTKQITLLVTPSMFEKVKAKAVSEGLPVNDYIRNLIEEDLKNEK